MLLRDGKGASAESWQFGIANQSDCAALFSPTALSGNPSEWLHPDSGAATILQDPRWHQTLCNGNGKTGDQEVPGLNSWFGNRYKQTLPGGRMTSDLLFKSRFFGRGAHARFQRFVCTGIYDAGTNRSLLLSTAPRLTASQNQVCADIMAKLRQADNGGKPIISVASRSPTIATAMAASLVSRIEAEKGTSVTSLSPSA